MIYATVNMTIGDYSSTCDNKILLYRGDKNVEIRIVMKGNKFTVLDSTYAQMIIKRPSATSVFSEPAPIQNDTVVFVISEDMIDELKEIGEYTFQVRLYDDTMTARATLPPCNSALIIERPIAVEGEAAVNLAMVNDSAVMPADATSVEEDIFTEDNKYNRTIWVDGDLITDARLNKIEDALYYINENGGNGGGGGATAPYISTELPETVMVGSDENFNLNLYFNSPNMGKGTLKVFINDVDVMGIKIDQGDTTTIIPGNLFAKGTNRIVVYVLDRVGVMSNSLVFYIRYGSTEISSDFDPYSAYDYGATIRYYFTPTALDTSLSLTFYMSIDGQVQQGVNCTSDTRGYYTFPTNLSADSHYCEAYVVDSDGVKSNVLSFNLIILDADTLVVASDIKEVSIEEGAQLSLDYKVYMKYNASFITNVYVDGVLVNTGVCNADFNYYKTSSLTKGTHTVKLEVFDVTETHSDYITWTVVITESTYEMLQPVNAGAIFIGTAVNKTNTDERKQYFIGHDQEGNEVLGTLSNFAYNSESGWVNDELIISGNSHAEIPVQPLANNAKYGFTLDIEFTSKQIGVPDAEVLTLWNDKTNCGIKITTEKLILQSSNGNKCDLYFTDNEKTHVMFVIDRQELKAKIYLNGVMCEAFHLNDYTVDGVAYLDDFTVNSNIILGGLNTNGYCKIRNLRVYQVALTTDEIMNNFISCEIDKAKQRELFEFQKGNDLPTLYVYCDFSGLGKDDKKPCKIVYNSTNEELYGKSFNLNHKQSQLQYQGTSSMAYPIKNYRLNLRDENGDKWYYTLPTAQPECRFTLKADFMSSGHWTNTGMAKFINDNLYNYNVNDEKSMNPFKWNHVQNGGKVNDFRETITGFPCRLILVNDGETPLNTGQNEPTPGNTKDMGIFNFNNDKDNVTTLGFNSDIFPNCASYEVTANSDTSAGAFMSYSGSGSYEDELAYLKESFELRHPDADDVPEDWGFMGVGEEGTGLKALIDWVDNCTDEEFVRDFEQHFHKDYTLRYFCLVTLIGAVDNLGKNMMLDTADHKIFFPRFYDIDTICSYDNSGQLKFDVDIEMEQGYWNTSSSRLWTRIRDLMHDDIVSTYNNMRQNGVSYENMLHYIYDEQIAKIPQTYYNKDYDVKYAPFADSYIGMAHGDTYEHVKRWLKQRFAFVDTLFDYAPSYNNDILTIRVNTTEEITLHLETYTPVYQHLSWYNGQMDKKKIDGKTSITFSGKVQAATDQEVLIYGGSNIKKITGIQSGNPNRLILGSATKLTELDASNCPLLAEINMNKANLSPHEYLNKVNLSNCPLLEGNLRLNNSPLIQEINIKGTNITGMNLPSSIRNLQVLRLPNTMTELTLNDAGILHTLEFDEGVKMQSVAMTNCNALTNVVNFDLLNTPSISLNNSYNTAAELYFRDTSNLSLSNMPNLERVIFTPNNEYETFEMINVANAPDYKVTTFNCPKLSTFMTTAPYRESWLVDAEYTTEYMGQIRTILEYIQTDGTQYFTTNYIPNANTVVEADMHMTRETQYDYFFGSNLFKLQLMNDSTRLSIAGMTLSPDKNLSDTRQTWVAKSTLGGEDTQPLCIFCGFYQNKMETQFKGIGKLYSFKIYENGVLLHEYEPCLNNKGVVCLYDKVVGNFLYASDGVLIPGDIVKVIDDEYVEVPHRHHGDIQPNTTFTANSIDISSTQFTDVKLLCTTDTNTLKLPTTVKNFYCDSSFDLDTNYLEDGEYDVVHGELVEPYTTDYEGEVIKVVEEQVTMAVKDLDTTWKDGYNLSGGGDEFTNSNRCITDFIRVSPNSLMSVPSGNFATLVQYDINKNQITGANWVNNVTLDANCAYVRLDFYISYNEWGRDDGQTLTFTPYVECPPNLIPSSADGSLIFSMYAPSNTVAPASGTWDLKGLEFDNFHTFGMNNDVKPSEDSYAKCYNDKVVLYKASFWASNSGSSVTTSTKDYMMVFDKVSLFGEESTQNKMTFTITASNGDEVQGGHFNADFKSGNSGPTGVNTRTWQVEAKTPYLVAKVLIANNTEWIQINNVRISLTNCEIREVATTAPVTEGLLEVNTLNSYNSILVNTPTSISMPARYDDYNITIKNADISPKTHNTMLYPLLVNEDNPITGTLDYTNYAGKHLSWSFAYTDEEYVDIIQPKDELLNSYEYRYNAFYDTEYEFDNPYEVAIYTSSASGVLPGLNPEFTYTYEEIDNGDGTYTTKIYANDLNNLPTRYIFKNLHVTEVLKLNMSAVTTMSEMFQYSHVTKVNLPSIGNNVDSFNRAFQGCSYLTEIKGIENWNTSNVTNMYYMFVDCKKLTSIDVSGFDTSNVTNMYSMFGGCNSLTSLNVSNFNTSKVTSMYGMFGGCSSLTSLDVSNFDTASVTSMYSMFGNCSSLTTLNLSNFNTSKVTDMTLMFSNCSGLTSLDVSNFDTASVTSMYSMFNNCSSLTVLNLSNFNTSKVNNMALMFYNCSGLTSLNVSNFNTASVTNMSNMFYRCMNLTSLDVSGFETSNVTNMSYMFDNCSKLTSLDLSGFDVTNVTNMSYMFQNCVKLPSIDVSNWNASKVENMFKTFCACSSITELNLKGFTNVKDWGSFCRNCTNLVTVKNLNTSKYSTGFGGNVDKFLNFQGCTSLRNIKNIDVSFTSTMATLYGNSVNGNDAYWMLSAWQWFRDLTNLVDITFTGQLELYDTMSTYYILRGCDTTKFTDATWRTFVSIFPTTSTSKTIVMGSSQAVLDDVPDEIKLALTQKGYTLGFEA